MEVNSFVDILNRYDLTTEDIDFIKNRLEKIYNHPEFQRRMTEAFMHHGDTILGNHIIDNVVWTYKLGKKYKEKKDDRFRLDLAILIAMLHDLYTLPWQNNHLAKMKHFANKHGFRHPIEAVINSVSWFIEEFQIDEDAKVIIDGIIHHMNPFPVAVIDNIIVNNRELNNFDLFQKLPENIKEYIIESSSRNKFLNFSWGGSIYKEGKIMSKADKKASLKEFKNVSGVIALVTGKNKTIK